MRLYGWEVPYAKQSQFAVGTAHPTPEADEALCETKPIRPAGRRSGSDRGQKRLEASCKTKPIGGGVNGC